MAVLHRFYCIAYAQKPVLNAFGDLSSRARGLVFDLSLPLLPYFVYVNGKGSVETLNIRRLA